MKKRKLISYLIILCMVLTMIPFSTMEANGTVKDDGGIWLWPVKASKMKVSGKFAPADDPNHKAIDIPGETGTTIRAARDGKVYSIQTDTSMPLGKYVVVKHTNSSSGSTFYSHYAHMNSISVKQGQTVKMGDKIGGMGNTGDSYGTHLHFQITKNTAQHYGRTYPNVSLKNSPVVNTNIGSINYTLKAVKQYTLRYSDGISTTSYDQDEKIIPRQTITSGVATKTTSKKFTRSGYHYDTWYIFKLVNGKAHYWCREKATGGNPKWIAYDDIPSTYGKVSISHGGSIYFTVSDTTIYLTPVWKPNTSIEDATSTLALSSYTSGPGSYVLRGTSIYIKGTVRSNYKISNVKISILNSAGKEIQKGSYNPNAYSADLSKADVGYIYFSKLPVGSYTMKISATDSKQTKTLKSVPFNVRNTLLYNYKGPASTIKKGTSVYIKGTLKSYYKISAVSISIFDANGKRLQYGRYFPNAYTADVSKADVGYIYFSKLARGKYNMQIKATTSEGTAVYKSVNFTVQ